jgi:hypothetical protein
MKHSISHSRRLIVGCAVMAALGSAMPVAAQTVSGQAKAIQTNVVDPFGGITTTVLADTGTLTGSTDAREASASDGIVSSLLAGSTLHATTIGWSDQVASEASVADLNVTVGATRIGADFVMARSLAVQGLPSSRIVGIDGLAINGVAVAVTGAPNQTINIPGGRLVINEQPTSTVVNALRVVVTGVVDITVASATARVQ